ncbi:FAD-dependent oxidoreductase [Asticcacaulis sp. ZE23SCel15]|uniref:NAD(P)/FAD-dependent oxidoreductase n=1 Tax=Asticcacaulis sp. ZE23SCel15 TaxID=3059027 RepID=UPI00265F66A7|nr:FAD-dependent oxidoreductase [Asticcacaulis sp. ZE23SCel15]WKL56925.1 FAD-dependent oxidoreductase [Asticcacaulis sp. ZE23SCel15]
MGVVIIGAGHAGGSATAFLRQYGYDGDITLIGAEAYLPYQRPPLSKAWLKGEAEEEDLYLRPASFYAEKNITLRLNTRVSMIDRDTQQIELSDGESISYDHLILATGSTARPFNTEGADITPYHRLHTLAHAEALKSAFRDGLRVGLIGAGYVGLEVAASARKLGCQVTVFEREPRVLARVASKALSAFFETTHEQNGVSFCLNAEISKFSPSGHGAMVHYVGGNQTEFDLLLVGIGALPCDDLARACGLPCENGVQVDHEARTNDPHIFAIGDVTSRMVQPYYEGRYRLESVPNALEQAKQAAAAIAGSKPPAPEVPWFWSDQYDYKLQIAGLIPPVSNTVVRGDPDDGAFSVFHLDDDHRLRAAECVNRPADFMAAKQLIAKGVPLDPSVVADAAASLKPFLTAG